MTDISEVAIQICSGGTFAIIATFFIKRYISINDKDIGHLKKDLNYYSERLTVYSKELSEHKIEMVKAIAGARDGFRDVEERIMERTSQVLIDLRETKAVLAQITDEQKTRRQEDKDLHGKIIWIVNKIPLIETQYQDILNVLHRRNR
jgi:hypothetical protein